MNVLVKTAVLAAVTAGALSAAAPANATCYVSLSRPTGLGVCASIKSTNPYYVPCVHVAVYTDAPSGDPDTNGICTI